MSPDTVKLYLQPAQKSFAAVLRMMPNVGQNSDFEQVNDDTDHCIFD